MYMVEIIKNKLFQAFNLPNKFQLWMQMHDLLKNGPKFHRKLFKKLILCLKTFQYRCHYMIILRIIKIKNLCILIKREKIILDHILLTLSKIHIRLRECTFKRPSCAKKKRFLQNLSYFKDLKLRWRRSCQRTKLLKRR